ncbi:MAG: phage tail protein [Methylotetracoccus sp.]
MPHDFLPPLIAGAGSGGGGQPIEAHDTIQSTEYMVRTFALCEGPVEGFPGGFRSLYLDEVPVEDENGRNVQNVWLDVRPGNSDQPAYDFLDGGTRTKVVNVKIEQATPVVRTIYDLDTDVVTVTINCPRLMHKNSTGDLVGSGVKFAVEIRSNGGSYVAQSAGGERQALAINAESVQAGPAEGGEPAMSATVHWVCQTPNGPDGEPPPVVLVEYRQVGETVWQAWEELRLTHVLGRARARGMSEFTGTEALWEFRGTLIEGSGTLAIQDARALVDRREISLDGKSANGFKKTYYWPLPGDGPWDIRITRISPDSDSVFDFNDIYWDSYAEVLQVGLVYPHTATARVRVDAKEFSSPPSVAFDMLLRRVQIPSNYNGYTRQYNGVWDGTFVQGWTDCVPWCFRDILTHPRFGLGRYVSANVVDKWMLYAIAQYCDQLVPDGYGGWEPRYRCNLYLQNRQEAYRVLQDMASIFRGLVYYGIGSVGAFADRPGSGFPDFVFTESNVVDGLFQYSGSSGKARHTVAVVAWNDPEDFDRRSLEYVEDREGLLRYGWIPTEVIAVGCNSRGQAHRVGRHILITERRETQICTLRTGLQGASAFPGSRGWIQDQHRSGKRLGGRIVAATSNSVTLDAPVELSAGVQYKITVQLATPHTEAQTVLPAKPGALAGIPVIDAAGGVPVSATPGAVTELLGWEFETRNVVVGTSGVLTEIPINTSFTSPPGRHGQWVIWWDDLQPTWWTVISNKEVEDMQREIVLVQHDPDKYDEIDFGIKHPERRYSAINIQRPEPVSNVVVEESLVMVERRVVVRVSVGWQPSAGAVRYLVRWSRDGRAWTEREVSTNTEWELNDAVPGNYKFGIQAQTALGRKSREIIRTVRILGKAAPPSDVTGFRIYAQTDGTRVAEWTEIPDLDWRGYVIRYSNDLAAVWEDMKRLHSGELIASPWEFNQLSKGTWRFAIKAVDTSGKVSSNAAYWTGTLPFPRLRNASYSGDEAALGWPGATTYVDPLTNTVTASADGEGTLTWDDLNDVPFDSDVRWIDSPGPLTVPTQVKDLGAVVPLRFFFETAWEGDSAVIEVDVSIDGTTWAGWSTDLAATYTARYFKARITIEGSFVTLSRFVVTADTDARERVFSGINVGALTAPQKIGTGDFRLGDQSGVFQQIQYVAVSLPGAGWTYAVVDKNVSLGPRIQIFNGGVLTDGTVDVIIKGV